MARNGSLQAELPIPTWKIVVIITPLSLLCLAILVGNFLVIVTVVTQKFLRTVPNVYLVSLASADFLVGAFILPLGIIEITMQKWTFGKVLCEFWLTADIALCTVSIFHLCLIALDRYRSITDGVSYLQRRSMTSALWTIVMIWVVTLWISSPPVLGWNNWDHSEGFDSCQLTEEKGYILHSALGSFVFPIILLVVLNLKIYREIQKRLLERSKMSKVENSSEWETEDAAETTENSPPRPKTQHSNSIQIQQIITAKIRFSLTKERQAAKILFCIMFAFLGCWIPFGIMYMLIPFLPTAYKPSLAVYQIVTGLGYLNSGLNPIIYTVFNSEFRKGYKGLLAMITPVRGLTCCVTMCQPIRYSRPSPNPTLHSK